MVVATPAPTVNVTGDVDGNIVSGDHNFVVNTNNGAIIYQRSEPRVKLRDAVSAPPRRPPGFVGRTRELDELERLIGDRQAAFIYGMDGLGKTALVRQAANGKAARACPNGVVYPEVQVAGLGLDDIIQRLFDALFDSNPQLKAEFASARPYLSTTQPLVILDNLTLDSAALDSLLALFPKGALCITSPGAPLNENVQSVKLNPLSRSESIHLFSAASRLAVDGSNRATLDTLCASLADVPAALVRVANAIRTKNVPLEQAHRIITTASPSSTDPLQAGVERAQALIISLLSPEERHMATLAGAVPGASVDRTWLENKAGGANVSSSLEALGVLQANSPRLRVPPGFRAAAAASMDETDAKEQLLAYLRNALSTRSLDFDFITDELGNLLGLHEWLFERKRWQEVIAIGRAVDPYLTLRGLWDAWRTVLDRVLQAARVTGDRFVEAWALHQLGTREIGVGAKSEAILLLRQALALRQSIGDNIGAAYTQHNLNWLLPPPPHSADKPGPPTHKPLTGGSSWRTFFIRFLGAGLGIAIVGLLLARVIAGDEFNKRAFWVGPTSTPISPEIVFTADRTHLRPGECAILHWSVQGANRVELNGKPVNDSDQSQVCPNVTTTYSLVAGGGIGANRVIQIVVETPTPPPFVPTIGPPTPPPSATPSETPTSTSTPTRSPTRTLAPSPTSTITLTPCPGLPIIQSFTASPNPIVKGEKSTLSWGLVSNATKVEIDQGIGGVGTPNQVTVAPNTTTTYTLTATGCGGTVPKSVQVTVIPIKSATLPSGRCFDIDAGSPVSCYASSATPGPNFNADLQLDIYLQLTLSTPSRSRFALTNKTDITISGCLNENMNQSYIYNLPVGRVVCVKTSAGRVSEIKITSFSRSTIYFDWAVLP